MPSLIQAAGVSPRFLDLLAREPLSDSRVLDVGCGSGRLSLALAPVARAALMWSLFFSTSATARIRREPPNSALIASTMITASSPGPTAAMMASSNGSCGIDAQASPER